MFRELPIIHRPGQPSERQIRLRLRNRWAADSTPQAAASLALVPIREAAKRPEATKLLLLCVAIVEMFFLPLPHPNTTTTTPLTADQVRPFRASFVLLALSSEKTLFKRHKKT